METVLLFFLKVIENPFLLILLKMHINDQFLKVQTKKLNIEFLFDGYCYDLPLYVTSPWPSSYL